MINTLAWTAFIMGVAGGPHCLGMCAAPCAAVTSVGTNASLIRLPDGQIKATSSSISASRWAFIFSFQAGRTLGYALVGALAAAAMESAAWLSSNTSVLRPLWALMHAGVLAWGLMLLVLARQPVWATGAGQSVWSRAVARVRPLLAQKRAVFATGLLWALMPCGLLYSALLVAALSGGPVQGALSMALFALGSAISLVGGPLLWQQWIWYLGKQGGSQTRQKAEAWGARLSGLILIAMAVWALWHDYVMRFAQWCGLA
ncbi:MAG: sulfite exporter TauE/SafE family protein [Betaproteobacteria bacterium]|jgi:sulfite exporter TauE/SafE|nr:sulfite exporter TauE/SafE family protein [Betaproteobacteria bacterium]